jgi:hypothetical protein
MALMAMTFIPASITVQILEFCRRVNPDATPVFITITPRSGCRANDCFDCVKGKVEGEGGRIQFGWSIWEWPGVSIEAEHHAVYEPAGGPPWIDITPPKNQEVRRRLFLPDNRAIFNFKSDGRSLDNQRFALNDDPLIEEFFVAAKKRVAILNGIPGWGSVEIDMDTASKLSAAEAEKERSLNKLLMKYTSQNAPCFCGSGKKFKRCHGERRRA